MKNANLKFFLYQNVYIIKWIKLLFISVSIFTVGILTSYIDYKINYPTDEDIAIYTDISYCIWNDGLKAVNFNNATIENFSSTSNKDLLSSGLKNTDLSNINIYLEFDNFTLKNDFSNVFTIKQKGLTSIHLSICPSNRISYIYSDFNFVKSKIPTIILILIFLIVIIAIDVSIEYYIFSKKH